MYNGHGGSGSVAAGMALAVSGYHTSMPLVLGALCVAATFVAARAKRVRVREF